MRRLLSRLVTWWCRRKGHRWQVTGRALAMPGFRPRAVMVCQRCELVGLRCDPRSLAAKRD